LAALFEYLCLAQGVIDLLSFAHGVNQPGGFENSQMMGHGRLSDAEGVDDLPDAQVLAAAQVHDLLAGFISDGFGEINGSGFICYHIDILLYVF
jgi:hypothetical protein